MAGNSISMINIIILWTIVTVLRIACNNHIDKDTDTWFTHYEEVTVFLRKSTKKNNFENKQPNSYIELRFNTSTERFSFDMVHDIPSYLNKNLSITVDDEHNISLSSLHERLRFYKGFMLSATSSSCNYSARVKVTREGVEGMLICGKKFFYLEPHTRYNQNSERKLRHDTESMDDDLQFRCIFYKSSDVRMKFNDSTIFWEGLVNVKQPHIVTKDEGNPESRYKRSEETHSSSQTDCTLHAIADHLFYTSTGHSDILTTISEISYLILQADAIFRGTDFDGDNSGDNIGFHVSKISIYTEPASYKMADATSVESYLYKFSEYDFTDYCLASAFTSQTFAKGVIGLAWLGSSNKNGPSGGICQHRILYQSKKMCLNTNLVTNVNEEKRLPSYVTGLILAHEMGHSFGSPHDEFNNDGCTPAGSYGNYLMYPYASVGDKPNNNMFSTCSINYMYPVIRNKGQCMKESVMSVCGNGFREGSEECDCGTTVTCAAVDPCCTPSDVSFSDPDHPCTFRRSQGSRCSPKLSHCCTEDCKVVSAAANKVCRTKSQCVEQSICDGASLECPDKTVAADSTPCAGGTKSCKSGVCIGSICAILGQNRCTCSDENTCYTCCLNTFSQCLPYENNMNKKLALPSGASCNEKQGFCNGEGKCISVDNASTIDRLKSLFTNDEDDSVKTWFKNQWYYIILAVLAFLFLIFIFVRTCRGDRHIQTSAYMFGRLTGIQREAELQQSYLRRRREEIEERYMKKTDNVGRLSTEMDFPTAVARMMVFFPTTPVNVIVKTLKSSASEESAVRWLLLRNYPFRRFV